MYENIYKKLLLFYPKSYKEKFGNEMLLVHNDLKKDELDANGKLGLSFWAFQFGDLAKSVVEENIETMQSQGMKKTLGLNNYNIIGGFFLLPLIAMSVMDLVSRIAQGDLGHYNHPVYNALSHTFIYWTPVLFTWVLLFPVTAFLLNVFSLLKAISENKKIKIFSLSFAKRNFVTLAVLVLGLGFMFMIKFHDFAPCFVHGIMSVGPGHLNSILNICRNA